MPKQVQTFTDPFQQRFVALTNQLLSLGYLGQSDADNAPIQQMDYVAPASPGLNPTVRLFFRAGTLQSIIDNINTLVNNWNWTARRARLLLNIYQDIGNLTAAQKTNISNNLFVGNPPLFTKDAGPNAASLLVLWNQIQMGGLSTADKSLARQAGAAIYVLDNLNYLVNPAFDTSINVPGEEAVP